MKSCIEPSPIGSHFSGDCCCVSCTSRTSSSRRKPGTFSSSRPLSVSLTEILSMRAARCATTLSSNRWCDVGSLPNSSVDEKMSSISCNLPIAAHWMASVFSFTCFSWNSGQRFNDWTTAALSAWLTQRPGVSTTMSRSLDLVYVPFLMLPANCSFTSLLIASVIADRIDSIKGSLSRCAWCASEERSATAQASSSKRAASRGFTSDARGMAAPCVGYCFEPLLTAVTTVTREITYTG
mmetsp:Transcript_9165/g.15739  ORF Transcript_9165/g.15739 Transcript_9165/m.15739 type:complete len:238 (+) Transcript_9165:2236-2949(+)